MKFWKVILIVSSYLILCATCISISDVEVKEDGACPIILGLKLGENFYQTKKRIDSLEAKGKIVKTNKLSFDFILPLITDSIKLDGTIDGGDFYNNKFYKFSIFKNIIGSWQDVNTKCNELKELFSHKYTHITADSVDTYYGYKVLPKDWTGCKLN